MHEHDKSGNKLQGVTQDKAGERGAELAKEGKELQREITVLRQGGFENKHSTVVECPPPPLRVCMSITPEGSHDPNSVECLFSMTLLRGSRCSTSGRRASSTAWATSSSTSWGAASSTHSKPGLPSPPEL